VSYSKGASVIRMLAEYLGENIFRKGLKHYLEKHAYGNASTNDLWDALEKVSDKPVGRIMTNWTRKPGYPLITLKQNKKSIELSQSRFFSSPLIENNDNVLWLTPVGITGMNYKTTKYLLLKNRKTQIKGFKGWIKLNAEEKSFIRVSYPSNFLVLLEKPIKEKIISQEDRFGIVRDVFALSQASRMSTEEALELVTFYKKEDSYIVWAEITSQMLGLGKLLFNTSPYEPFKKFSQELFKDVVDKVGWNKKPKETYSQTLLRSTAIYALGTNGDRKIIKKANEVFEKFYRENAKLESDLKGVVYNLVAENGGEIEYKKLMELYERTSFQEEKDRILRALCMFKDEKLLKKSLDFSLSKQAKSQDVLKAINFVWANPWGRRVAFDYLKNHWPTILRKFEGGHLFSRFVTPAGNFVTEEEAREVEKFFKRNSAPGIERTVAQVLEQIRSNAAWRKRDRKKIEDFLSSLH
ncbi:MAG: M1 family metallopeptidase, partial [Patescibacteria group bacterium]|nr:M1 family metallopeptidase [Patescibacteria group bacterium]